MLLQRKREWVMLGWLSHQRHFALVRQKNFRNRSRWGNLSLRHHHYQYHQYTALCRGTPRHKDYWQVALRYKGHLKEWCQCWSYHRSWTKKYRARQNWRASYRHRHNLRLMEVSHYKDRCKEWSPYLSAHNRLKTTNMLLHALKDSAALTQNMSHHTE